MLKVVKSFRGRCPVCPDEEGEQDVLRVEYFGGLAVTTVCKKHMVALHAREVIADTEEADLDEITSMDQGKALLFEEAERLGASVEDILDPEMTPGFLKQSALIRKVLKFGAKG